MRRVILIDLEETPNFVSLYSYGGSFEVYSIQQLEGSTQEEKLAALTLGNGDAAMLVGSKPFDYLKELYHFGIRSENYFDCSKLRRLSIEGGAFVKCVLELPSAEEFNDFMSEDFSKHRDFSWFKQKILHDYRSSIALLDYMESLPEDTDFGYDYEGSGMPLDRWYELSGVSISTVNYAGFISLTDVRHTATPQEYQHLLTRLGTFVLARMKHIWTFNLQYEYQVSHRMLNVDAYELSDSSVVNILDGYHLKKYSLKWTGNRVLETTVWDTAFDRISDLIDTMLFTETGKLKRDKKKIIKPTLTPDNFTETDEWKELCRLYPNYIDEFASLIREYWGNAFMCIPSEILGYYCNLDAFYTLMIYKARENVYSKECFDIFLDNLRLGARLMSHGLYIDEPFRARYEKYANEQMAWAITYCATARCWVKMEKHKKKAANPKTYKKVAIKLIEDGCFHGGNAIDITKDLLVNNLDTLDTTETGLDEGGILFKYGPDFADQFITIVKQAMIDVKMKTKIDETIVRKKKILSIIADKITPLLGLDNLPPIEKHIELEKYMYYKRAYDELERIRRNQLTDINNMPETVRFFGVNYSLPEYSEYISNNYFKCKSPEENNKIALEFTKLFQAQTVYLTAMLESTQQLPETTNFYKSRGIENIKDGFDEFMKEWEQYFRTQCNNSLYPNKAFDLALSYYRDLENDKVKETWTNFNGFKSQSQFFSQVNEQSLNYEEGFTPNDMIDDFFFMRKLCLNYLVYKKYSKLDSTYVGKEGMFKKDNKYVIEDAHHIPIREADPDEPGAVEKCFVRFRTMEVSSKRWSSGFHTIISHGDCKDVLCPPNIIKDGKVVYGGGDALLTYFDISSAEVKSAGSGGPFLVVILKIKGAKTVKSEMIIPC